MNPRLLVLITNARGTLMSICIVKLQNVTQKLVYTHEAVKSIQKNLSYMYFIFL